MLYYNNPEIQSYKEFYLKRAKSIYPMFWMAWFSFYFMYAVKNHSLFYNGHPFSILLSIAGVDEYFSYTKLSHYNLLGEWFLGAIILLYILYPFLLKLLKYPIIASVGIVVLYIWQIYTDVFEIESKFNLISCIISFWFGILFIKYYIQIEKLVNNRKSLIALFLCFMALLFIPFEVLGVNLICHVMGIFLFLILFFGGTRDTGKGILKKIMLLVGKLSYPIFLVHHRIIYQVVSKMRILFEGKEIVMMEVLGLVITFLLTIIIAGLLYLMNDRFKKLIIGIKEKMDKRD